MKTVEEKAKSYDNIVNKLRCFIAQGVDPLITCADVQDFFPELKEDEDDHIRKEIVSAINIYCSEYLRGTKVRNDMLAWIEKQVNPVDKIKSKFNKGEWITNGDYIWKIIDIKPLDYILQSQDGNIVDDTISYIDEEFNLWTIQDAKDGDVLATEDNCICIFDNTVEEGKYPFAYCGLSMYGFKVYDRTLPFTHDDVYPATKEQRELLFQKMKEVGYEWDSEKKELKKIADKEQIKKNLQDNSFRRMFEQKFTEWSEDDKKMIIKICQKLYNYPRIDSPFDDESFIEARKEVDWLNSFKDRVQPQNHWKPSDEQMNAFEQVYDWYNNNFAPSETLTSLYNDLKKLKEE